jgi:hypothetical protein
MQEVTKKARAAGLVFRKSGGRIPKSTVAAILRNRIGIAGADLVLRRKAEAVLRELRIEIAEAATKLADYSNEPPE